MSEKKSTVSEHLIELRSRLLRSMIFLIFAFIICYIFSDKIYNFLVDPYAQAVKGDGQNRRLIFTALHETFLTYLKLAFFSAFFFSFPLILNQIWKFIAPGLYKDEKLALLPFLVATPILFLLGGMAPNIRVNAISPGPTLKNSRQSEKHFKKQWKSILLKKKVDLKSICDGIKFLIKNNNITGEIINIDSGQRLAWNTPDIINTKE